MSKQIVIGGHLGDRDFLRDLLDANPEGYHLVPVINWWNEGEWFCASVEKGEVFRSRHNHERAVSYALSDFAGKLAELEGA